MSKISLKGITKKYGKFAAVDNIDLDVEAGEFLTLLGPSGCGKTTTLRMIAGLEEPTSGELSSEDRILYSREKGVYIPPEKRNLGFMFQSYALWPHMTVRKNITLGLESKKLSASEINERVEDVLDKVQLRGFEKRFPSELSGGQQQRVALARMIAAKSDIFLMDEPLSNLDSMLRVDMRSELKHLHNALNSTTVYVTHDQVEALTLSDRIVVMNEGKIAQLDTPEVIYKKPANLFVARFVGSPAINLIEGKVESDGNLYYLVNKDIKIEIPDVSKLNLGNKTIIAGIRAEDITVTGTNDDADSRAFSVYSVLPGGSETIVTIRRGDVDLVLKLSGFTDVKVNDRLNFSIAPEKISLFDSQTEKLVY